MLNLHFGNRIETLADTLLDRLGEPAPDPFESDWLVVTHASMGRWVAQRKAARDGVCANVEFFYPAGAIWRLLRAARPELPVDNPYHPDALTLRLLQCFDGADRVPGLEPLVSHLERQDDLGRFRLARRLAQHFDEYLLFRPDWILDWEEGGESHWQAVLWRSVAGRDGWHWARCWRWLRDAGEAALAAARLPSRLALFAVSELAPSQLDCLSRFAARIDVDLYQWTPSSQYWGDASSPRARAASPPGDGNPLLPSLGLPLRDMIDWLLEFPAVEREQFVSGAGDSLLIRLQNDLLHYRRPAALETVPDPGIEIHVCASRRREVEVCYDRLLDLLEGDPSLHADDILVVAPSIEDYLPYVRAVFARIPWTLYGAPAERGRNAGPAFRALLRAFGAAEPDRSLLELLAFAPIRRRFGLRGSDLADVRRWVREGGLYGGQAGKFSWAEGAQRLIAATLLGARSEAWPAATQVHGSEADAIGRLLEFLDTVLELHADARVPRPLSDWTDWSRAMADRCLEPLAADEAPMRALRQALWRVARLAEASGAARPVAFSAFREMLETELGSAARERVGIGPGVTFASLSALRLMPARVLCGLGVNEGEFPSPQARADVDLIAARPRRGDRSRRQEDRQVFLEWLASARERLLLTYVGVDQRDGTELAASPLLSELLDYLDQHYRIVSPATPAGQPHKPSARIVLRHPVQPFSTRYGREPGLISYADHFAVTAGATSADCFQRQPLAAPGVEVVEAAELAEFLRLPAKHYLRRILGIWLDIPEDLLPADPPVELGALARYRLILELLREPAASSAASRARVDTAVAVPDGPAGDALGTALLADVARLRRRHDELTGGGDGAEITVDSRLGGVRLNGLLSGVFAVGRVVLHAGSIRGKHLLELWLNHLLLNLAARSGDVRSAGRMSLLLARGGEARLAPVADPATELERLINHYHAGMHRALPFFPDASRAFAARAADRRRARREARRVFMPTPRQPYTEGADAYVRLAFRDAAWDADPFESLAFEIWSPLLAHLDEKSGG